MLIFRTFSKLALFSAGWFGTSIQAAVKDVSEGRTNPRAITMASTEQRYRRDNLTLAGTYDCGTQQGFEPVMSRRPVPGNVTDEALIARKGPSDDGSIALRSPSAHADEPTIVVGLHSIIPRWGVSPSHIALKYFVQAGRFPSQDDANFAAAAFQHAADQWNSFNLGISISQTHQESLAHFDIVYRINNPTDEKNRLALSFFPEQHDIDIIIYKLGLSTLHRPILRNVLLHEIGHVLGLRHEFAVDQEHDGAVPFMQKNPVSVMSYNVPPTIQQSDKDGIKAFYKLKDGARILNSPITDFKPKLRTRARKI